jgi:hypothetical protein
MSALVRGGTFVAYIPSLARDLGSTKAALIVQHIHFRANGEAEVRLTYDEIAEGIGCSRRTVATYVPALVEAGVLSRSRTCSRDAAWTYRVNAEHPSIQGCNPCTMDDASSALSDSASSAPSSTKKVEEVLTQGGSTSTTPGRPTRIPQNWKPAASTVELVKARHSTFTKDQLNRAWSRYVLHHRSRGDTAVDWDAGFVLWVDGDAERYEKDHPPAAVEFDQHTGMPKNPVKPVITTKPRAWWVHYHSLDPSLDARVRAKMTDQAMEET